VITSQPIVGTLLAGGLSRRMGGGDKNLLQLLGKSILQHVVEKAEPQVDTLILNANGVLNRFSRFELPVVSDVIEGYAGPLAGILTGLEWASKNMQTCKWVATFATDAPFIPENLVAKLLQSIEVEGADMACAMSNDRTHPPFALWPVRLKDQLRAAMVDEKMRKIDIWTARYKIAHVPFLVDGIDPFFNINKPDHLEEAKRFLSSKKSREIS
jgi:molybdopterin-guanine dinucleotide biosynthesis protein A